MIKIDLSRIRKEERKRVAPPQLSSLKEVRLESLLKMGAEYYAGLFFWACLIALLAYYWKVEKDKATIKAELDRLNAEKTNLQAQVGRFSEERKRLEESIASIKREIENVEKGKDIIVGLKSYYDYFNSGLSLYTSYVPKSSWISTYKQTLNLQTNTLSTELEINAFDYQALSSYGKVVEQVSQKVNLSTMERKLNPHGFEYYSLKLNAERPIVEVR